MPDKSNVPVARAYTPTALPSVTARALAFLAIVLGGLCGGLIGYAVTDLQCGVSATVVVPDQPAEGETPTTGPATTIRRQSVAERGCTTVVGVGTVAGAAMGAGGVAVISVLVLRAMAEWRRELEQPDAS
ncbi:MAG TPA: hypothetical protein VMN58_11030 [Acidimicrobiales bacterium]|nr:hypothetical protein [Acidimicrobiales bacterium]